MAEEHEATRADLLAAAAPAAPLFGPGALLAGRYRVVRFLAQGGMGQVYEADDLELGERVALKTIRPALGTGEPVLERFKREILLSRKVTHANVCRIFDFGRHVQEGGGADVLFLTMELLRGESLSARLRRGPLAPEEALPLVEQVVAALAAAHRVGVVHRDLKPGNVVLVPAEAGPPRAVVTDFGLARSNLPESGELSSAGLAVGTAEYMAPEQVEGGPVGPAADIYALGVVLYEMLTGVPPFVGRTPLSTALRRLTEAPPSPRRHVPALDRRWEDTVLRCLEREPSRRFPEVEEVWHALTGAQPARRRRRAPRTTLAAAAAVGVAASAAALLTLHGATAPGSPSPAGAVRPRRAVAVLGFKNLSQRPESAWLSTALSEMLTTELAAGGDLRTLPGENVSRMKVDLSLADAESLAPDTLGRIRGHLGADVVVLGSYLALGREGGGRLRLDLRLQDTLAGETLASLAEQGIESELFTLVARSGAKLRERLGAGLLSADEAGAVRASRPATLEAARLYSEGLSRLRLFDALAARDLLRESLREDPDFALAHGALSEAWLALGYEGRAREAARRAFDAAGRLPREERYSVEGRYREASREWARAAEVYRALYGFFPDSLDYGLRLGSVQVAAGQGREALATVAGLRRLPAPAAHDPRLDLLEAQAAAMMSDFQRQRAAAERAARRGEALGARLLAARARLEESAAWVSLGELGRAAEAAARAREISAAAGDRAGVAGADFQLATALWQRGRFAEATRAAESALAGYRAIGNRSREGWVLNRLAVLQHYRGRLAEALATFDAAQASFEQAGERLGVLGVHHNSARVLREMGELSAARREHDVALRLSAELGNPNYRAHALFGLGETRFAEGDLAGAREAHEQALALWTPLGRRAPMGESQLALAEILLEEGRGAEEAERRAREALAVFQAQGSVFNELHARVVLGRALLARGRRAEAGVELAHAAEMAASSEHPVFRLSAALARARFLAEGGEATAARSTLAAVEREARAHGLVLLARRSQQASAALASAATAR